MKLPTDYVIPSLGDLKRVVVLMQGSEWELSEPKDATLEMTEAQYLRYKELVWKEDPIRFYNGMEIKLCTPAPSDTGDGSV